MAGKSGRNISNVPEKSLKKNILSWEGMLVVVFVLIVIFCRSISPNFHVTNVLREMPKYLAEGFIMLAMAYVSHQPGLVWYAIRDFHSEQLFLYVS